MADTVLFRLGELEEDMKRLMDPETGVVARYTSMERNIASMARWIRWGIPIIVTSILSVEGFHIDQQRQLQRTVTHDVQHAVTDAVPPAVQHAVNKTVPSAVQKGIAQCLNKVNDCTAPPVPSK